MLAKIGLFPETNAAVLIIFFVLTGFSLNSFSILGASIFRRAQLSGITVTVVALAMGVAAQISAKTLSTAAVVLLSLLFTPMTFVFHQIWLSRYEYNQMTPNLLKAAPWATWRVPGLVFWICMLLQTLLYPVLAAWVERAMFYTDSHGRKTVYNSDAQPIVLSSFTKHYAPNWWFRMVAPRFGIQKFPIQAVNNVTLAPMKGQIMCLVGANGMSSLELLQNSELYAHKVLTAPQVAVNPLHSMPSPASETLQVDPSLLTEPAVSASVRKRMCCGST